MYFVASEDAASHADRHRLMGVGEIRGRAIGTVGTGEIVSAYKYRLCWWWEILVTRRQAYQSNKRKKGTSHA